MGLARLRKIVRRREHVAARQGEIAGNEAVGTRHKWARWGQVAAAQKWRVFDTRVLIIVPVRLRAGGMRQDVAILCEKREVGTGRRMNEQRDLLPWHAEPDFSLLGFPSTSSSAAITGRRPSLPRETIAATLTGCSRRRRVTAIFNRLSAGVRYFQAQCSAAVNQRETVAIGQPREKSRIEFPIVLRERPTSRSRRRRGSIRSRRSRWSR